MGELVLVTGGSGFIGSECIVQLLSGGYRVRTTVRNLSKKPAVLAALKAGGVENPESVEFFACNLESDDGWAEACAGCDYVLHVAAPFPLEHPKDENEIIVPSRDGALRALRFSRDAGVKRVVLTSSIAAISFTPGPALGRPFTEEDWTDVNTKNLGAYIKSKTVAERAAWDFMKREGGNLELSVVNPVGVYGPLLSGDLSSSVEIVKKLLDGELSRVPNLDFGIVDVRDVADLHIRCMKNPAAKGERFICTTGHYESFLSVAKMLTDNLGPAASKVPTKTAPDFLIKMLSCFKPELKQLAPYLSVPVDATNEKARRLLGWDPRPAQVAVLASAESLIKLNLLKK